MIGKSRMKGEKVVTPLIPYGAEKPSAGMVRTALEYSMEIFWDPPKGDFGKYVLTVDKLSEKPIDKSLLRMTSLSKSKKNLANSEEDQADCNCEQEDLERNVRSIEISHKLTTYTILGLEPGEKYKIELKTKTGSVETRQPIIEEVLTRPLAPSGMNLGSFNNHVDKILIIFDPLPP